MPGDKVVDREVEKHSIRFGRRAPNPVVEVEGETKSFPSEVDEPHSVGTGWKPQNLGIKPPHLGESGLGRMDDNAHQFRLERPSHGAVSLPQFFGSA